MFFVGNQWNLSPVWNALVDDNYDKVREMLGFDKNISKNDMLQIIGANMCDPAYRAAFNITGKVAFEIHAICDDLLKREFVSIACRFPMSLLDNE